MRVQGDDVLLRQHLRDPNDVRLRILLRRLHELGHLRGDLRRVGRPGAEHNLDAGVQVADRAHEMKNPLLARDPPDEEHDRNLRVDAEPPESRRSTTRAILVGVDPVVDDADALRWHPVQRLYVLLHRLGDSDDAVGVLVCRSLDPGRCMVGGTELLHLPRAVRLERVRGEHQPRAGERPREATSEVGIPSVAVDDVGRLHRADHRQVADERVEQLCVTGILGGEAQRRRDAADAEVPIRLVLLAEAEHVDAMRAPLRARQLAGEILDVDTRAAVDVRRILVREESDAHGRE